MDSLTGFDLWDTALWYDLNSQTLDEVLSELRAHVPIETPFVIDAERLNLLYQQLTYRDLIFGLQIFPKEAAGRWIPKRIRGSRARWFHRNATPEKPLATRRLADALSPTAIVPSYIQYHQTNGCLLSTIWIYRLPQVLVRFLSHAEAARLLLLQAYVHELSHSLIIADWANRNSPLDFPDGTRFEQSEQAIKEFADIVVRTGSRPFSHYSATYWKEAGTRLWLTANQDGEAARWQIPAQEELAETITGYLLGFVYRDSGPFEESYAFEPCGDRPEVQYFVDQYLHAVRGE